MPSEATRSRSGTSAQFEEQLLEFGDVGIGLLVRHRRCHQFEPNAVERRPGGGELGDDVTTLCLFFDKALNATDLAFDPAEPVHDVIARFGGKLHKFRIPLGV